jgi:uncharacterized HAD superfamily protein
MKKVITLDFDECLADTVPTAWGGSSLAPVQRIVDFAKQKHAQDFELHIVTFRNWHNKKEVESFCKHHKIPIVSVVCTEGKNKVPFIKQLNSTLHVDDSVEVCTLCIMAGINVLLVDRGQEQSNATAKFISKI